MTEGAVARAEAGLDRLHPASLAGTSEIEAFLRRLLAEKIPLIRGMNRRIVPEQASVVGIDDDLVELDVRNFEGEAPDAVFLNCTVEGEPYFFSAPFVAKAGKERWQVRKPSAIYRSERRDRTRRAPREDDPRRLAIESEEGIRVEAEVADVSADGAAVWLSDSDASRLGREVRVKDLDGRAQGTLRYGEIFNRRPPGLGPGRDRPESRTPKSRTCRRDPRTRRREHGPAAR